MSDYEKMCEIISKTPNAQDHLQENKQAAELHRLRQKQVAVSRWHALAVSMGYDGVEPALLSLQAMQKGPRAATETSARHPDWCDGAITSEGKLSDGSSITVTDLRRWPRKGSRRLSKRYKTR